ncbi:hypothetical protein QR685DRAFT_98845 [Neurospora intermedia]|uniref:Uncharacterized protein n=1 Tax=Neurospora intermedia TaxID=5142 RepID=A0ABR3D1E3_NEUIN
MMGVVYSSHGVLPFFFFFFSGGRVGVTWPACSLPTYSLHMKCPCPRRGMVIWRSAVMLGCWCAAFPQWCLGILSLWGVLAFSENAVGGHAMPLLVVTGLSVVVHCDLLSFRSTRPSGGLTGE